MTNILDLFSRIPLGSDITYNNGSFITIANALKMAILPKSHFYEKYPDIQNRTNYSGILEELRTDNGKDFTSGDLELSALELKIVLHHVKATKSWQKGAIEQFFKKNNDSLIGKLKGKTFSNILERAKYDPEKETLIKLSDFKRIMYKWLYDVYPFEKVRIEHGKEIIPHKLWESQSKDRADDFVDKKELDIIFGNHAKRVAKHGGIEINNLKYDGLALREFRSKHGDVTIDVKFDPLDLGVIYFYDAHERKFEKLNAIDFEYANKLTKYQHEMIKEHVKEDMQRSPDDIKLLMDGKIALREMINELLGNNPKLLSNSKGAKLREGMHGKEVVSNARSEDEKMNNNKSEEPTTPPSRDEQNTEESEEEEFEIWEDDIKY